MVQIATVVHLSTRVSCEGQAALERGHGRGTGHTCEDGHLTRVSVSSPKFHVALSIALAWYVLIVTWCNILG
jgi:hypothetical protein